MNLMVGSYFSLKEYGFSMAGKKTRKACPLAGSDEWCTGDDIPDGVG